MAKRLRKGDRVSWKSHGGTAVGEVVRRLTSTTKVKGHTAKATEDDPQYLVETDDGTRAAHKPSALTRLGRGGGGRKKAKGKGKAKAGRDKGKGKAERKDKAKAKAKAKTKTKTKAKTKAKRKGGRRS